MVDTIKNNSLYNRELLNGMFFPKTKAYYFKEWNNFSMQFHAHNAVEIMYVISGTCLVEVNDVSITMRKGEFILLDANVKHNLQVENDKPCRMLNVEFGFHKEDIGLPSIDVIAKGSDTFRQLLCSSKPYIFLRDSEEVYVTLKSLIMELDRDDSEGNLLVQLLYYQLLIRLSRLYISYMPTYLKLALYKQYLLDWFIIMSSLHDKEDALCLLKSRSSEQEVLVSQEDSYGICSQ